MLNMNVKLGCKNVFINVMNRLHAITLQSFSEVSNKQTELEAYRNKRCRVSVLGQRLNG